MKIWQASYLTKRTFIDTFTLSSVEWFFHTPPLLEMNTRLLRYSFYFLWAVMALIQATYTELLDDEAYYWKFSKQLDWGYFDHPPMIAFLIRLGSVFIPTQNELSVRLFMIILNISTIYLIEKIVKPQNTLLFFSIILSSVFIHAGFLSVPDSPLLFFTTLFLYHFVAYAEKDDGFKSIIIISLCTSLLLYSKYHGILVVFFSIIANLGILKRKSFYMILLLTIVFYIPHIYWQYQNDFVSIRYHLLDRSLQNYSISNTLEYLLSLIFTLSGLSGALLLCFCFSYNTKSVAEKTFKWNLIGVLSFFLVMTLKGRVEANWIAISLVPMFVISFKYIETLGSKSVGLIYKLSFTSILLILIVRTYMIFDFTNNTLNIDAEIHNQEKWASQIKEVSKGEPVIFMNSYQKASKYEFYSGIPSYSFNNIWGRKNQYSLRFEEDFHGKRIFLIYNSKQIGIDSMQINGEWLNYKVIDNFASFPKIKLKPATSLGYLAKDKEVNFKLSVINNYKSNVDFNMNSEYVSYLSYQFFQNNELISNTKTPIVLSNDMINKDIDFAIRTPAKEGNYVLNISITTGDLPPTINSDNIKVTVQ